MLTETPALILTNFCSGHVYVMGSAPAGLCSFNSSAISFNKMSILSEILHQRRKTISYPSPDAIFVATFQTRDRAMRPSAARVRSRVNFNLSDWIKSDRIIVVLLYTCGWQNYGDDIRDRSRQVFERSFSVNVNTSKTRKNSLLTVPADQLNIQ